MGVKLRYVRLLPSGRLEYRRAFSEGLRPYVGKRELIQSLEACSLSDTGAMERYRAANDDFERLVSKARKVVSGSFDELDAARIAWLAETFKADILAEDERQRVLGSADRERHEANEMGFQSVLEDCSGPQIRDMFEQDVMTLGASQGWHFDAGSEAFATLCYALLKAQIGAVRVQLARDSGAPVDTPEVDAPPARLKSQSAIRVNGTLLSFDAMAREALDRPVFGFAETTRQATATACRFFKEANGDLPSNEITRAHVSRFIDMLAKCPAKRPYKERSWTLPKLVAAYDGKDAGGLSVKTMTQHVGMLSAIWSKLQGVGQIQETAPNPFARHKFPKVRRTENEGLTLPEVQAIFDLPLFTAGERPRRSKGEALFWVPWLLLWTGARPEEIAQLVVSDIRQDADSGEWTLTITDEGEHPRKGARRLKTGDGRRTFPVPRFLVQLGLLDYRQWLVERNEQALFPALGTKGKRKELFGGFTESWGAYLREHKALPLGKRPAREFRHTWNTEARRHRVPEEAREYIMGHSRAHRGQNTHYGGRDSLGHEIHNVTFDKLDFSRVRRWEPSFK